MIRSWWKDGEKNMFIRTERLFLRPAWPEDLEEMTQALAEEAKARSDAGSPAFQTSAGLRSYFDGPQEDRLPRFCINVREDGGAKLIGGVGLGRSGSDVELGYWIAPNQRGKGYAAEAVRSVLALARALGHREVIATDFTDSEASARVLEQSGFRLASENGLRFSICGGVEAPVRLYVASLADKLFDLMGVGPQVARA
jgi:[ribosomal protein S5]-alanine N-acetyltransferase